MNNSPANVDQVAYCGLYCASCKQHKKGKCPGCQKNEKATWCKIRSCCIENGYRTCAECQKGGHESCKYFNNFMSKLISFAFKSDRAHSIRFIKTEGIDPYALKMAERDAMCFKKHEQN